MLYKRFAIAILLMAPLLAMIADYFGRQATELKRQHTVPAAALANSAQDAPKPQAFQSPVNSKPPPFEPSSPLVDSGQPMINPGVTDVTTPPSAPTVGSPQPNDDMGEASGQFVYKAPPPRIAQDD